jgi:hypothetical protein
VRRPSRVTCVGLLLAGVLAHRQSHAGIASSGPPQEPLLTTSRVGLESVFVTFDLQGQKGDFLGVAARGDYRLSRRVGLRLEVPMYTLHLDGQGTNTGIGDAELRVRVLVLNIQAWRMYVGLADQMPTGQTSLGIGQGANQLTPYVTAGYRYRSLVVYGAVADAVTIRPSGAIVKPDWVDPSTDHELRYGLGAIVEFSEAFYGNAAVTGITELVPGSVGNSLCQGGASLGFQPNDNWKLVLGLQLPIAGERRFDTKTLLSLYYFFF